MCYIVETYPFKCVVSWVYIFEYIISLAHTLSVALVCSFECLDSCVFCSLETYILLYYSLVVLHLGYIVFLEYIVP